MNCNSVTTGASTLRKLAGLIALSLSTHWALGQAMSLYSIVDLSLRNSPQVRMAEADVKRSAAGLAEQRDTYLPSFSFSSNIGYSYGFPVGQPSVANVQSNSLLLSFSQPDYIRSARAATDAARFSLIDVREKIALEASLDYIELNTDTQELAALKEQRTLGKHLVEIEEDRVAAGLDNRVEATQARLTDAQLALRELQLRGHAEVLAERIANLTGLPLTQITADSASIPQAPGNAFLDGLVQQSHGVQAAYAQAKSKLFVAFGDSRQADRPTLGLGVQYARYAMFNNYAEYYNRFQHNNFGIGINITIPVFDESRRAHARGSAADAAHATAEAELARNQEGEQKLELSGNLQTLAAQQKVAELQQELAQDQLDAISVELTGGTGRAGVAPVTPKDEAQARIDERRYAINLLDAKFQLLQAQLQLLRTSDGVESWAMQVPKP